MAKRNIKDLRGFNIYHDKNGRPFYYDYVSKKTYAILNSDLNNLSLYVARIPILIITIVIFAYFTKNVLYTILGSFAFYAVVYYVLRKRLFKNLIEVENIVKRESTIKTFAMRLSSQRIVVMSLITIVFAFLSYLNVKQSNYTGYTAIFNYVLIGISAVIALLLIILLIIKIVNKNKKN